MRRDADGSWQAYSASGLKNASPLLPRPDGTLWIGVANGVMRFDPNGFWDTYTKANTQGGLPNDIVWALARGADGVLWIGTPSGLVRLGQNGTFETYTNDDTHGGIPDDQILALALGYSEIAKIPNDFQWTDKIE